MIKNFVESDSEKNFEENFEENSEENSKENSEENSKEIILNKDFEKKLLEVSIILPGFKEKDSKKNDSYSKNHYFIELVEPWNKEKLRYMNFYQKSKELEIFNQIKTNIKFDSYPELKRWKILNYF